MKKKSLSYALLFLIVCLCALLSFYGFKSYSPIEIKMKIASQKLQNPSDIIRFQGKYVATELLKNRLVFFDDLNLTNLQFFDPKSINKSFSSPHYLAISPWGSLLISNGWGTSIVEINDLKGNGWKEFSGIGNKFNAPHGLCVDQDGWIYVGDSLNSRLVRFKDMDGKDWQVFPDHQKRISYIRELVCQDGVIWISNSYEGRIGLNPGCGANILRISDFDSGMVDEIVSDETTKFTAIMPLRKKIIIGLWGINNALAVADLKTKKLEIIEESNFGFGIPYGTFNDSEKNLQLVIYSGSFDKKTQGGIIVIATH